MSRLVLFTAPDLLTASRIEETARAAGIEARAVAGESLPAACRERPPDLVVIDLTAPGDPPGWIRAIKLDPATAAVPVLGFYPHVRDELRRSAMAAGADRVLPRSAFVSRMAAWLAGTGPPGATLPGRSEPPSTLEADDQP
jgi:CheY-like chemotaxis protein